MRFNFTANGTNKEDTKAQVRGDGNRDCPDPIKQAALAVIDCLQLPAGHSMRVEMSGEITDKNGGSVDIHIETGA